MEQAMAILKRLEAGEVVHYCDVCEEASTVPEACPECGLADDGDRGPGYGRLDAEMIREGLAEDARRGA